MQKHIGGRETGKETKPQQEEGVHVAALGVCRRGDHDCDCCGARVGMSRTDVRVSCSHCPSSCTANL